MRAPWNGAARVLDGKATAAALKAELKERVTALRERGVTPGPVSYTHLTLPTNREV